MSSGYFVDAVAECRDCGWGSTARNAHGNGARHAKAHGHKVYVEVSMGVFYGPWPDKDAPKVPKPAEKPAKAEKGAKP